MSESEGQKRKPISRLFAIPAHMLIVCFSALASIAIFFVPALQLVRNNIPGDSYSIFSLLKNGSIEISPAQSLSIGDGRPLLLVAGLLPLAVILIVLFYNRLTSFLSTKIVAATCLLLLALNLVVFLLIQTMLLSTDALSAAGFSGDSLHFAQLFTGNLLFVVLAIGMCAALFGALGIVVRFKMLSYPYVVWLLIFTILPLALIFFRAFFVKDASGYSFTLGGFETLLVDRTIETRFYGFSLHLQEYFSVFLRSLDYALWTTVGCLMIAYPLAYALSARVKRLHSSSSLLLMFFVLPMWINTMLRTYAWRAFFGQTGVLNNLLMSINLIDSPILFLKMELLSDIIVKLVLVNDFLPFMLLPIYSVLVKLDENLNQAAHDLGANSRQAFFRVILPLSMPGVISGIQMVFMPSMTFYMIPDIISEGSVTTIGNTVQSFILNESPAFQQAGNVLSLMLLIFVLFTMGILRNQEKDSGGGGMIL
jgi:ABC-type spermidine/putrescine transport system permease subunit I